MPDVVASASDCLIRTCFMLPDWGLYSGCATNTARTRNINTEPWAPIAAEQTNTFTTITMAIGPVSVNGESALPLVQQLSKDHDLVLKTFRMLIADLCQQFGGGHPG